MGYTGKLLVLKQELKPGLCKSNLNTDGVSLGEMRMASLPYLSLLAKLLGALVQNFNHKHSWCIEAFFWDGSDECHKKHNLDSWVKPVSAHKMGQVNSVMSQTHCQCTLLAGGEFDSQVLVG
jgi:hypothetical protein